jgi:molybdopterin-guanine dinucleotide biosynthesis protein A
MVVQAPLSPPLIVAVLAGGEGRRMGGFKALRPFRGAPLVAHAVALARRWSPAVIVVARDAAQVEGAVEVPLVVDRAGIAGPLAGLAAALGHAQDAGAELALTIPCDMPNLPVDFAARLAAGLGPRDGAALPLVGGALQPACGLWRASALARLPAYVASGQSSLRGFAAACGLAAVDFGAEARAFANANTPEELEQLARETP